MASRTPPDKRARLVETAAQLVHAQGFERTTIADIARDSGVPLGNVYYYFKTKESLGEALVDRLAGGYEAACAQMDSQLQPRARLEAYIQMTIDQREALAKNGCPLGTLNTELHKTPGPLADHAAEIFERLLDWLEKQFRLIGKGAESRALAVHLLSAIQGVSLLGHALNDVKIVSSEANRLKQWVRGLSPP